MNHEPIVEDNFTISALWDPKATLARGRWRAFAKALVPLCGGLGNWRALGAYDVPLVLFPFFWGGNPCAE